MKPNVAKKVRKNAIRWYKKLSRICPEYQGHLAYFWVGRMNHEIGKDSVAAVYFKDDLFVEFLLLPGAPLVISIAEVKPLPDRAAWCWTGVPSASSAA